MAYRMTIISDSAKIGQMSNGDFDLEIFDPADPEAGPIYEVNIPRDDAEEIAKYMLKRS